MAYHRKKGSVLESDKLDITPLIDAVFLLLVFFMVTTVFKNPAQLKLTLPDASKSSQLDKRQILVEMSVDGEIAIQGEVISMDTFETFLSNIKHETGYLTLLIRADIGTKHGDVLKVMKMARQQQIETIAMAVNDLEEE